MLSVPVETKGITILHYYFTITTTIPNSKYAVSNNVHETD